MQKKARSDNPLDDLGLVSFTHSFIEILQVGPQFLWKLIKQLLHHPNLEFWKMFHIKPLPP